MKSTYYMTILFKLYTILSGDPLTDMCLRSSKPIRFHRAAHRVFITRKELQPDSVRPSCPRRLLMLLTLVLITKHNINLPIFSARRPMIDIRVHCLQLLLLLLLKIIQLLLMSLFCCCRASNIPCRGGRPAYVCPMAIS